MNTKVKEAFKALDEMHDTLQSAGSYSGEGYYFHNGQAELEAKDYTAARTTLAAHIAQQDATIARAVNEVAQFREVAAENDRLREALAQLLGWVDAWSPNFTEDADWPEHESQIRAALNQEQAK